MSLALASPRFVLGVSRSETGRAWVSRLDGPMEARAEAIRRAHDLPDSLARVLAGRGYDAPTVAEALEPTVRALMPDPSTMTGMDAAVTRLRAAVEARERVAIFGDYDVDGACATALLARVLRAYGLEPAIRIPDRLSEGYGPNVPAVEALAAAGVTLLVTVDCGTTGFAPLERAAGLGLDVVVLDHHLADAALPPAVAVVNPNRQDDMSGLGHLCAAGVVFMAAVALGREMRARGVAGPDLMAHLDLVALATVADVVPLKGLNRAFVRRGLDALRQRRSVGLTALCDAGRLSGPCEPYHLGFVLGPRINAGGRIGDSGLGARLLMTDDPDEAARLAAELDRLNGERQVVEQAAVAEAVALVEAETGPGEPPPVLVVAEPRWHPGVLGLVAARLKERYGRPAFALGGEGACLAGSGRSIAGVDLGRAVRGAVAAGLAEKGGGHPMAAGVTVEPRTLPALKASLVDRLGADVARARSETTLALDGVLTGASLTPDFAAALQGGGPFGAGCPEPIFALADQRVVAADVVGGHVRVALEGGDGRRLRAMAFRAAERPLGRALLEARGGRAHVAACLALDRWNGQERVELRVSDVARP
jgi:single-stranded-DNA-specific exonuclease